MPRNVENQTSLSERRCNFVLRCLARGLVKSQIVTACRQNKLFWHPDDVPRKRGRGDRPRKLSRQSIQKHYVFAVKKQLREETFNSQEETATAYLRLAEAIRLSHKQKNASGIVRAQREINRMLGLRRRESETLDPEMIMSQLSAMQMSVAPRSDGNGDGNVGPDGPGRGPGPAGPDPVAGDSGDSGADVAPCGPAGDALDDTRPTSPAGRRSAASDGRNAPAANVGDAVERPYPVKRSVKRTAAGKTGKATKTSVAKKSKRTAAVKKRVRHAD